MQLFLLRFPAMKCKKDGRTQTEKLCNHVTRRAENEKNN